jgi:hypothetical protein
MVTTFPNLAGARRAHEKKKTTGWVFSMDQGIWFYLRDGLIEAQVFKVCPADTMQTRWAGKIYGGRHKVGQTFEDDYTARSVVETMVNLMVAPGER